MGVEPHVDALPVEGMVAFGQQARGLAFRQPAEADGALHGLLEVLGSERHRRERLDDGRIEAALLRAGGRLRDEDQAGAAAAGDWVGAVPPLGVEVQNEHKDQEYEDDEHCCDHEPGGRRQRQPTDDGRRLHRIGHRASSSIDGTGGRSLYESRRDEWGS